MGFCKCIHDYGNFRHDQIYNWKWEKAILVTDADNQTVALTNQEFIHNFERLAKMEDPDDLCYGCETGLLYEELCECPVCKKANILGNYHSYGLYCPNGCTDIPLAVDFCGRKNCQNVIFGSRFSVFLSGNVLTKDQLITLGKHYGVSVAVIYRKNKFNEALESDLSIKETYKLMKYLDSQNVGYSIEPPLPKITRFEECWNLDDEFEI